MEISGKQIVKLRKSLIKSKNHFKQLAVAFKIYSDFESLLTEVKSMIEIIIFPALTNMKIIFFEVLLKRLCVLMIDLASQLFFTEEKMQFIDSLKHFLKIMMNM